MIRILGISGSLRTGSYNTSLLRAAQSLVGPEVEFDVATLHGIPHYDGDFESTNPVRTSSGVPTGRPSLNEMKITLQPLRGLRFREPCWLTNAPPAKCRGSRLP